MRIKQGITVCWFLSLFGEIQREVEKEDGETCIVAQLFIQFARITFKHAYSRKLRIWGVPSVHIQTHPVCSLHHFLHCTHTRTHLHAHTMNNCTGCRPVHFSCKPTGYNSKQAISRYAEANIVRVVTSAYLRWENDPARARKPNSFKQFNRSDIQKREVEDCF